MTMYEARSSSQVAAQAQEKEGGDVEVYIDDSLGAIVAHLQNIQVQSQINKEHANIIQQQSLHMALINNELKDKLLDYQMALAIEASKVDAEHQRVQSFIHDNQDLTQRLQAALKHAEEKENHAKRL